MTFTGFPVAALDFYDDLEMDNTRSFWERHKHVYDDAVKAPMVALCAELTPEFGESKIFRPYRDVRFGKDKTPYKTAQGGFFCAGPSTGYYVEVSARGVRVGGGLYHASGPHLSAIRAGMADDTGGRRLQRLVTVYETDGWDIGGEQLKTSPRGYAADHPRIALLRRKQLFVGRAYGFDDVIHTAELADRVRADWVTLRPLVEWLAARTDR